MKRSMTLDCQHVWEQVSEYIEGTINAETREAIERHLSGCRHCAAIYDSTRNILTLVGDERTFELPVGYGERLHSRLQSWMNTSEAEGKSLE
jgi:anti-sigma factor RsiW